jgi:hypothetical protein
MNDSKRTEALRKLAQAIQTQDASYVAKVVQTLVREGCIVDGLYPPIFIPSINDPQIKVSDTNIAKRYLITRFATNFGGPSYSINLETLTGTIHATPGYAITYIDTLATKVFKINELELEFFGNILDEVVLSHTERFGDQVDYAFFNALRTLAFTRDADTLPNLDEVQYLNAKYYSNILGSAVKEVGNFSRETDYLVANDNKIGARRLLADSLAKMTTLKITPGKILLPVQAYTKMTTWQFTSWGLEVGQIFVRGFDQVYGGAAYQGIQIVPIRKTVNLGGVANEVMGPVNINVVGSPRVKDIDSTLTDDTIDTTKYMGYIVPAESFFGLNVIVEGVKTTITKQILDAGVPQYYLVSRLYRGLSIGATRAYVAFPAY